MKTAKKYFKPIDTNTEVSSQEKALLLHGTKKFPIYAERASKYSLFFRYLEDQAVINSDEPVYLIFQNNGQKIELGPCQILPGSDLNGWAGRLVFLRDVYDIHFLLKDHEVVKLQDSFRNLPQVLARKDKIRQPFKDYVANLAYDLQIYKQVFDDLDFKAHVEPEDVKISVQEAVIRTEGADFRRFFQGTLYDLIHLVEGFSPKEHHRHALYFRNHLWEFILVCAFAARATLKPRGYAGDSEQMRMIYLNDHQGDSTFAKLLHKHAVEHTASRSVRNRIGIISQMINIFRNTSRWQESDKIDVLSVGSGSAFELKNIFNSPKTCDRYKFILFDQDPIALGEAVDLVNQIERKIGAKPDIKSIRGSVRTMLFSRKLSERWGKFDFIYSLGLFDYLNLRVAEAVINRLYQLLKPGGELVIGNFNVRNPSRYYMEYWGDWVLLRRTEEEFRNLFQQTSKAKIRVLYDDTGCQMFLDIKKKKTTV